jgi:hypothetical protein
MSELFLSTTVVDWWIISSTSKWLDESQYDSGDIELNPEISSLSFSDSDSSTSS